jgi:small subunit ribosomal protein S6
VREYDTTFIVQPEISEEAREALIARLKGVLERAGATPLEVDDMGKKKLAYDIKKFQKGHYLALMYLDTGKAVGELERALRLDESILRFLTVRKEDAVDDVAARQARAVDLEKMRRERAVERAAREAEERAARDAARGTEESGEGDEEDYDRGGDGEGDEDADEEGDERSPRGE